jgi:hypothetical protein
MAFGLFKNGDQLYEDAVDLVKRREFDKAKRIFEKSIAKEGGKDDVAAVMVAILNLNGHFGDSGAYRGLAKALESIDVGEFEFGLTTVNSEKLVKECGLTASEIDALAISDNGASQTEKGKTLIEIAQRYQMTFGADTLIIPEIFNGDTTVSGLKKGLTLMAVGNECLAAGAVWNDPKKGAEYEQIAYNYRRQLGQDGNENMARVKKYAQSCTCWMCGRNATGSGIHFFPMSSDVSPILRKDNGDLVSSCDDRGDSVYVCRACYTAVSRKADEIARHYHEIAINDLRQTEARLQAQIAALEIQIQSVRFSSR